MTTLLLSLALAMTSSLAIETLDSVRPISRRPADLALRFAGYGLVTLFWFAFSWRPWLAGASCVLTVAILVVISRLKRAIIGEPLVFSDFALLRQVPRHPELYYTRPLTDPRMAGSILVALALVATWYAVEPAILPQEPSVAVLALLGLPIGLITLVALSGEGRAAAVLARWFPSPDLSADISRVGLPATIIGYALRWRALHRPQVVLARPRPPVPGSDRVLVLVQLESFVDPVRLGGPPLPLMDLIRSRAVQHGRLRVPAHGAYTMRTEHAVLTGRDAGDLGFGLFDPYLSHGGDEPTSLARLAREAGFETLFVHPFHRDFFNRGTVVTKLGFDRLIMEADFADAPRIGPYFGDVALAERVLAEVRERLGPLFLFCVTMENHGPWKPGRLPGIDDPLAQYLTHVENTGRAVEALVAGLEGLDATLCIFGDHAPALPSCRPGFGGTATDYAIFRFDPESDGVSRRLDLSADALGRHLRGCLQQEARAPGAALPPL